LQKIARERSLSNVRLASMIVVGKPFAEILRIAADLDFSLIVLGIRVRHRGGIKEILSSALELFYELMYTLLNRSTYLLNILRGKLFPHRSKEDEYGKAAA
jgi:hypothetical protein